MNEVGATEVILRGVVIGVAAALAHGLLVWAYTASKTWRIRMEQKDALRSMIVDFFAAIKNASYLDVDFSDGSPSFKRTVRLELFQQMINGLRAIGDHNATALTPKELSELHAAIGAMAALLPALRERSFQSDDELGPFRDAYRILAVVHWLNLPSGLFPEA